MEHTKGEWKVGGESTNESESYTIGTHERYVAYVADTYDNESETSSTTPEDLANAKLIAAAPELLSACQIMVEHCAELFGPEDEDILMLVNVINKATT